MFRSVQIFWQLVILIGLISYGLYQAYTVLDFPDQSLAKASQPISSSDSPTIAEPQRSIITNQIQEKPIGSLTLKKAYIQGSSVVIVYQQDNQSMRMYTNFYFQDDAGLNREFTYIGSSPFRLPLDMIPVGTKQICAVLIKPNLEKVTGSENCLSLHSFNIDYGPHSKA